MDVDDTSSKGTRAAGRIELTQSSAAPDCCSPLVASGMTADEALATAHLFKALADPARVRIVNMLFTSEGPVCVCDITPTLGLAQPTVSFHLKKLVEVGLLRREQRGVWAFYSVDRAALERLRAVVDLEGAST